MGIRGNMWVKDSQNNPVKGHCQIADRRESIELLSMNHKITSPIDMQTGKRTGQRTHMPITIIKKIDMSTPFFNKACCSGECLKEVIISLYHINEFGREEEYFRYTLDNVRVMAVQPLIGGTDDNEAPDKEKIALIYERIQWQHLDGNYAYSDSWNERS